MLKQLCRREFFFFGTLPSSRTEKHTIDFSSGKALAKRKDLLAICPAFFINNKETQDSQTLLPFLPSSGCPTYLDESFSCFSIVLKNAKVHSICSSRYNFQPCWKRNYAPFKSLHHVMVRFASLSCEAGAWSLVDMERDGVDRRRCPRRPKGNPFATSFCFMFSVPCDF